MSRDCLWNYKSTSVFHVSVLLLIINFVINVKKECNLFTHEVPRSSQELIQKCPRIPRSNWNLEMLVFEDRGKTEYPEKTSRSREENQQQTQPTYDTESKVPVDPLGESQVDPQTILTML